jgi:hypothetical protein
VPAAATTTNNPNMINPITFTAFIICQFCAYPF